MHLVVAMTITATHSVFTDSFLVNFLIKNKTKL